MVEVWIRHRDLEFLEDIIDEGLGERQREVYQHVRRNFEAIMGDAAIELDLTHFQSSISGLFDFLKQSTCGNVLLQKLDAFDNYLMSHSTNVCYLALLLGMKLERYLIEQRIFKTARDAKDLQCLGLGCLLHDVGKMRIPAEILNKPAPAHHRRNGSDEAASGVWARDGARPRAGRGVAGGAQPSSALRRRRLSGADRQPHRRNDAADRGQADSDLQPHRHGVRRVRRGHDGPRAIRRPSCRCRRCTKCARPAGAFSIRSSSRRSTR